jgi:hypothetical protein
MTSRRPGFHATWRVPRGIENCAHNDSTARGGNGVSSNCFLPANRQKRRRSATPRTGGRQALFGPVTSPPRERPIAPGDRPLRTQCSFVPFGRYSRAGLPARRCRRTQDESRNRHRTTAQGVLSRVGGAGACSQRAAGLGPECARDRDRRGVSVGPVHGLAQTPAVTFVFNMGQLALNVCIAVLVVHALTPASGDISTQTWAAALVAMLASSMVASSLIPSVSCSPRGRQRVRHPRCRPFRFG